MSDTDVPQHGRPGDPADERLLDFAALRARVGNVLIPVAGIALVGAIVEGLLRGLTFGLLGRWFGIFVVASVLGVAVVTALHAAGGADRAGRRGERLSGDDVGLAPRKVREGVGRMRDATSRGSADASDPAAPDDPAVPGPADGPSR